MERSEGKRLANYAVDNSIRYVTKCVSEGTQEKWFDGRYFYKTNLVGNEGLCEYFSYVLLKNSTLPKELVTKYEYCKINGKLGCRSENFLKDGEMLYTAERIYSNVTGRIGLSEKLWGLQDAKDRLAMILEIVEAFGFDSQKYRWYLNAMLQFDMLIENVDRHTHNYGLVYNGETGEKRLAPIFDNGRSLRTDRADASACTISGSFEEQVLAFGFPVETCFRIDFKRVFEELEPFSGTAEYRVLRQNVELHRDLFENTSSEMNVF